MAAKWEDCATKVSGASASVYSKSSSSGRSRSMGVGCCFHRRKSTDRRFTLHCQNAGRNGVVSKSLSATVNCQCQLKRGRSWLASLELNCTVPIGERVCRGMLIGWSVGRIAAKPKGLRKKKQVRGICGGCRHDIGLHCTRVLAFGSPLKRAEARVPAVACGIRGEI